MRPIHNFLIGKDGAPLPRNLSTGDFMESGQTDGKKAFFLSLKKNGKKVSVPPHYHGVTQI